MSTRPPYKPVPSGPRRPKHTVTGRVVYERKRHEFSYRDVARIAGRLGDPRSVQDFFFLLRTVDALLRNLRQVLFGFQYAEQIRTAAFTSLIRAVADFLSWIAGQLDYKSPIVPILDKAAAALYLL